MAYDGKEFFPRSKSRLGFWWLFCSWDNNKAEDLADP